MAELTGAQVTEAFNALAAFDEAHDWKSSKVALKVGRIIRALKTEVEELNREQQRIDRKYVKADEEGNPLVVNNIVQYTDREAYEDCVREIQESVITINYAPIKISHLEEAVPKKGALKIKGRWAGIFDEAGIIDFGSEAEAGNEADDAE